MEILALMRSLELRHADSDNKMTTITMILILMNISIIFL